MTDYAYLPSATGWPFLLSDRVMVGVELPIDAPRLVALWSIVSSGQSSAEVLDELTRGGISQTPSFVLVESRRAGGIRAVVRGDVEVAITAASGDVQLSGAGVSSWTEQLVDRVSRVELVVGAVDAAGALPVSGGVVLAARVVRATEGVSLFGEVLRQAELDVEVVATRAPGEPPISEPLTVGPPSEQTLVGITVSETPEPASNAADGTGEPGGYDHLFGETVLRRVEDAAVNEAGESGGIEDHTMVATNLGQLRAQRRAARQTEQAAPAVALYLELSTGGTERLDQPIVVGRAPSASRVSGRSVPRLVTMTTPNQDISRTHAQVSYEGGSVVVTDLHSKNGTMITLPGKPPQKLREGEPAVVIVGTVIDLGDGATLTVREG